MNWVLHFLFLKTSLLIFKILLKIDFSNKEFIKDYIPRDLSVYVKKNKLSLYIFVLLSIIAVTISFSFYKQLKSKLNNPFASVILVQNQAKWSMSKLEYFFMRNDSLKKEFDISNIYDTKNVSFKIIGKNSTSYAHETGRVIDGSDSIYEIIKNSSLVYNQEVENFSTNDINEKSYGLYVTSSFLQKLGYSKKEKYIDINLSDRIITLPILGVNDNLPGDNFLISNLCNYYLNNGSMSIFKKRDYIELVNFQNKGKNLFIRDFTSFLKSEKITFDSQTMYFYEDLIFRAQITERKQNYTFFENLLNDFKESSYGRNYTNLKLLYYPDDLADFIRENKDYYPEWFNIQRSSLKNTQNLKDFLSANNLKTEIDKISTQRDYYFISKLLLILLVLIILLTTIAVSIFLKYSLSLHILHHRKEIGILRTLGIESKTLNLMYYIEIISYSLSIIIISFLTISILLIINIFLYKIGIVNFIFLNLINWWVFLLIGIFLCVSIFTIRKILTKLSLVETGNLIYERDFDLL